MGKVERLLIVAPTSVVAVWPKELQEYAKFKYTCKTLLGEKKQRLKQIDDLIKFPFKALKVAVINYESTWRPEILEKLKEFDADMVIADESQRIKTYDAAQSKAMHELGDQARYKLILSGTPVQTAAIDIWSQYRFLDKTVFGDNFFKFRGRYAIMGGYGNKKIVGYKDLEGLQLVVINSVNACMSLSEATARAVQRIPDAHCNGDMHAALEYATNVKHKQKEFLTKQGVEHII